MKKSRGRLKESSLICRLFTYKRIPIFAFTTFIEFTKVRGKIKWENCPSQSPVKIIENILFQLSALISPLNCHQIIKYYISNDSEFNFTSHEHTFSFVKFNISSIRNVLKSCLSSNAIKIIEIFLVLIFTKIFFFLSVFRSVWVQWLERRKT